MIQSVREGGQRGHDIAPASSASPDHDDDNGGAAGLACPAFAHYVNGERWRGVFWEPDAETFRAVLSPVDLESGGQPGPRVARVPRTPRVPLAGLGAVVGAWRRSGHP
jgi:hypothetical protein